MLELDVNKINGKALLGHMGLESATQRGSCYWRCAQSTDWSSPTLSLCIGNTIKLSGCILGPGTGTRKEYQNDVKDTRFMRGADCGTDHQMVRSRVAFSVRRAHVRNKTKTLNKLNTNKFKDKQTKAQLEEDMNKALKESRVLEQNTDVELQWKALRMVVHNTAEKVCGKPKRKH